jgi:tyrosyl-tRNA synthetase
MWKYWVFLTDLRQSEIVQMQAEVAVGALHPMQAKKNLAWSIVRDFHTAAAADAAGENWAKQFQQRAVSEDAPVVRVSLNAAGLMHINDAAIGSRSVRSAALLVMVGLASSSGEATRKLNENAVSINGTKSNQRFVSLDVLGDSPVLRLGKRSVRVEWVE